MICVYQLDPGILQSKSHPNVTFIFDKMRNIPEKNNDSFMVN